MQKTLLLLCCALAGFCCAAQQKDIDSFTNALRKHPQMDSFHAFLLYNLAHSYMEVNPNKGAELAGEAILLAKKLHSLTLVECAYGAKAANYISEGLYDSALYYYQNSLPICEKLHEQDNIAKIYVNMGTICFQKSDYAGALTNANKSLKFFQTKHDTNAVALIYGNIAIAYAGLADYTMALEYHLKCMRIYENTKDSDALARCCFNLIEVYKGLANYPVALEYAKKASVISEKTGYHQIAVMAIAAEGQVYFYMGKPEKAIEYYLLALPQADKYGFLNNKAIILQMTGNSYLLLKQYAEATDYCEKSKYLLAKIGDEANLAISYEMLGQIYLACPAWLLEKKGITPSQRITTALKYFDSSLLTARKLGAKEIAEAALTDISGAYAKAGNYAKALEVFKQAAAYKDSLINDSTKQQTTRLEMQYGFDRIEDAEKAANDKKQALATAEIKQQQIIRNAVIAGALVIFASGIAMFLFYKKRKDADLQRYTTETDMKVLRTQMNPHFIFNSLNSIADYIDKYETKTASDFTVKFARLMRMILENSERKEVSLADDLHALDLYMQLECMRLNGKFSYEIKVDEAIDRENTTIPPLLLQPFVENSIWHGMSKKIGTGKISVFINREGKMISCVVEDDGPGIQATNAENPQRKHLGVKITRARIEIINKLKKCNATVTVLNKEVGVRAEIRLPLELSL